MVRGHGPCVPPVTIPLQTKNLIDSRESHAMIATEAVPDEHWYAYANALPCLAFSLTPDGQLEFFNDRWVELTGVSHAPILGELHKTECFREARKNRTLYEDDFRIRQRDGRYRAMRSCARPMCDEAGTIVRWIGTVFDVEDRNQSLALQAEAEARLDTFLETVPQIVWTADETGWIDWYNKRWFDFTGQSAEEAAGWGWQAAHHPDDFPRVMEAWPASIETGQPFEMEFRLRRYDGEFHWFLTRVMPARDEAGRVVRWYGSNTDIEEQKRMLRRSVDFVHKLQQAFLPDHLPTTPGVRFDAVYLPAESETLVGGDWYDAIELPDGRIVISCGDVAGHGVTASVTVGRIRQAIVFAALDHPDPGDILIRVNRVLRFQESAIATCAIAILHPTELTFIYALAGHPPPVIANRDGARMLDYADAPPLGVFDDFHAATHRLQLAPDSVLAFYSDGVTEFERDIRGAEVRLITATAALVGDRMVPSPARAVQQAVMGTAASTDDVALLIVHCVSVEAPARPSEPSDLVKRWRFHSSDARTARNSRKELMAFLRPFATSNDDLYTAELVLGEILANTVEHAPGLVELTIDWNGEYPKLTAVDTGPGMVVPQRVATPDTLSEDGRGLFLINALARDVTIDSSPGRGTRLCATLELRR